MITSNDLSERFARHRLAKCESKGDRFMPTRYLLDVVRLATGSIRSTAPGSESVIR
jgi:hypothetical protein